MAGIEDRAAVRRLLQRAGFGPRPGELSRAVAAGFEATLAALFTAEPGAGQPPPALRPLPIDRLPQPLTDQQQRANQELLSSQLEQLRTWWLDRMITATHPLTERMTFFWHGHFATSVQKVRSTALMLAQYHTMRRLGGGDFRALAQAMVVDPAMLVWLDGNLSGRIEPNENLARELMELFTIGVGHFTETDVKEAARALTGWQVNRAAVRATLTPANFDQGAKTVLGHTEPMGAAKLVELLTGQPQCARFITERLWARFVSHQPPPAERLDTLAALFTADRNVHGLLRAMLASPEFRSADAVLVREPVEWLVAACRALSLRVSGPSERLRKAVTSGLSGMAQVLFAPSSVGGWPSGGAWLTPPATRARLALASVLASTADLRSIKDRPVRQRVTAVGVLLAVDQWSDRTAEALDTVAGDAAALVALALVSPEFVISG